MSGKQLQKIGIVGGGAWGTALAAVARRASRDVLLWAHEPETVAAINETHTNPIYLPGVDLDPAIKATAQLSEVATCDALLIVSPAQHLREILGALQPHVRSGQPLVLCCKGIEQRTGLLMSQVAADVLPDATIAVLSGPSFAAEVARELPVAVTLATGEEALGRDLSLSLIHI